MPFLVLLLVAVLVTLALAALAPDACDNYVEAMVHHVEHDHHDVAG